MASLSCSVCGQNPAVVVFTDLEDGTSINPCIVCLPELVEYVVSYVTAVEEAMAMPADASLSAPESDDETPVGPEPTEESDELPTPPTAPSGRSRARSEPPPTDTAEPGPVATDSDPVSAAAE